MGAANAGLTEAVAMLLEAGADAAPRNWNGESALDLATTEIGFELISRSLFPVVATRDQNALNWLRDDTEHPIKSDATLFSLSMARASWLPPAPPPPPPPPFKETPAWQAIRREKQRKFEDSVLEQFRTLLRIGADPNQRSSDRDNSTPLGEAIRLGLVRAARLLLDRPAPTSTSESALSPATTRTPGSPPSIQRAIARTGSRR